MVSIEKAGDELKKQFDELTRRYVEVRKDDLGKPYFHYTGTIADRVAALGIATVHLSITHDAGIAAATTADSIWTPTSGSGARRHKPRYTATSSSAPSSNSRRPNITGSPAAERQSGPSRPPGRSRSNCRPVQSVGLGGAAGMPPKAEQLPTATT